MTAPWCTSAKVVSLRDFLSAHLTNIEDVSCWSINDASKDPSKVVKLQKKNERKSLHSLDLTVPKWTHSAQLKLASMESKQFGRADSVLRFKSVQICTLQVT